MFDTMENFAKNARNNAEIHTRHKFSYTVELENKVGATQQHDSTYGFDSSSVLFSTLRGHLQIRYKAGYIPQRPPKFQTPLQYFFGHKGSCSRCDESIFIRCAWCGFLHCFLHFWQDVSLCQTFNR